MNLKLKNAFKSLLPFEFDNLADLVVLTGLNGSGKTHLLVGINSKDVFVELEPATEVITRYVHVAGLHMYLNNFVSDKDAYPHIGDIWSAITQYKSQAANNYTPHFDVYSGEAQGIVNKIKANINGEIFELSYEELKLNYPLVNSEKDLFNLNIAQIYKRYRDKWCINRYQQYLAESGEDVQFLNEESFLSKYGSPPWELVNRILLEANVGYRTNSPNYVGDNNSFDLKLISISDPTININFSDLSSGEMVLVSLALALYAKEEKKFPNVLLLDEPDATLHPSMSKQMIEVLKNVFVNQLNIKVVLTTHSPSTVAIAPEESIYIMDKVEKILKKADKDEALKILTTGIPTLSIDYKSHRQVFVESPTDLKYYQMVFDKMNVKSNLAHKLYFISNGYGISNCDQVIKVVKDLNESGNISVRGIVDWDNKDTVEDGIIVHGYNARYSLENFIFDPIYLSILLIEKRYGKLIKAIGFDDTENQYDLPTSEKAQQAIDFVVGQVKLKIGNAQIDDSVITCHYNEGIEFDIPKWYLHYNGHDLKNKIIETFEPLESFKRAGEYEIEYSLIKIIGKVFPIIPIETKKIISTLSS